MTVKDYFLSLLSASLVMELSGILAPPSVAKHLRLISSLLFLCILSAPLPHLPELLSDLGEQWTEDAKNGWEEQYREEAEAALEMSSKTYFVQSLTTLLEQRFSIPTGEVRCGVLWESEGEALCPKRITVILSGSAVWKDPTEIEETVAELLGCECVTAIEFS